MISVIVCSISKPLLNNLQANIQNTIGVSFEIIAADNTEKNEGICAVYNRAAAQALYPYLCFVHEDVFFETKNWGAIIEQYFTNPKIGLIGLAGGDTKSYVPTSWSTSYYFNEINIIQHSPSGKVKGANSSAHFINTAGLFKEVVAIDGVFMCVRRDIFSDHRFDEFNLKGFHGYDVDFSLQLFGKYSIIVIADMVVHHFSEGNKNKKWVESALTISKKWKASLPVSVYPLTRQEFTTHHWKAMQIFLDQLFHLQYGITEIIFYYLKFSSNRFFRVRKFLSMGKFITQSFLERDKHNQTLTDPILNANNPSIEGSI